MEVLTLIMGASETYDKRTYLICIILYFVLFYLLTVERILACDLCPSAGMTPFSLLPINDWHPRLLRHLGPFNAIWPSSTQWPCAQLVNLWIFAIGAQHRNDM